MADLLQKGPRYTDFFIANPTTDDFTYIAELLKYGLSANASVRNLTSLDDQAYIAIAKQCYQLATRDYCDTAFMNRECIRARKCPSTIRFVTHSMGGMMVSRYMSESADLCADGHAHDLYQRYLEYTDEELTEDLAHATSTLSLIIADQLGEVNRLFLAKATVSQADNPQLRKAYRDERQNSVDKIILENCPIAGTFI